VVSRIVFVDELSRNWCLNSVNLAFDLSGVAPAKMCPLTSRRVHPLVTHGGVE
jgi:hypothetical protein